MARIARVVAPHFPHHITQRGNRRLPTFFKPEDYRSYLALMAKSCAKWKVEIWAYCLMSNHVHLIAVPTIPEGLSRAIGEAHRGYTRLINSREGWRGYLWQGRFSSFVMDQNHLIAAAHYIEHNPVRAGLTRGPASYKWSSAKAHLSGKDDVLVKAAPLLDIVPNWRGFLRRDISEKASSILHIHERTGRPLGNDKFVSRLERKLNRTLAKQKPGPKKKKR